MYTREILRPPATRGKKEQERRERGNGPLRDLHIYYACSLTAHTRVSRNDLLSLLLGFSVFFVQLVLAPRCRSMRAGTCKISFALCLPPSLK